MRHDVTPHDIFPIFKNHGEPSLAIVRFVSTGVSSLDAKKLHNLPLATWSWTFTMNATVHDVTAAFPIGNRLPPSTMVCRSRLGRCTGKTSRRRNLKTFQPLHKVLNTFILPNNHRPEQLTIIHNHGDSRKNQYGDRKNKTNTRTCTNTGYHFYSIVTQIQCHFPSHLKPSLPFLHIQPPWQCRYATVAMYNLYHGTYRNHTSFSDLRSHSSTLQRTHSKYCSFRVSWLQHV
ncbi:unnamed protein product [Dicrocoelium dendriticum]|nr:unnamed protein product [Dicrocoelium dendriticum]